MRHRNSGRQLSRDGSHRKATLQSMANALIKCEAIRTTVIRAKELRRVVEPLVTMARVDSIAKKRLVYARVRDRESVSKLFSDLGPRFKARPGGFTRIMRCGYRAGDAAPMAIIEFVERPEPSVEPEATGESPA